MWEWHGGKRAGSAQQGDLWSQQQGLQAVQEEVAKLEAEVARIPALQAESRMLQAELLKRRKKWREREALLIRDLDNRCQEASEAEAAVRCLRLRLGAAAAITPECAGHEKVFLHVQGEVPSETYDYQDWKDTQGRLGDESHISSYGSTQTAGGLANHYAGDLVVKDAILESPSAELDFLTPFEGISRRLSKDTGTVLTCSAGSNDAMVKEVEDPYSAARDVIGNVGASEIAKPNSSESLDINTNFEARLSGNFLNSTRLRLASIGVWEAQMTSELQALQDALLSSGAFDIRDHRVDEGASTTSAAVLARQLADAAKAARAAIAESSSAVLRQQAEIDRARAQVAEVVAQLEQMESEYNDQVESDHEMIKDLLKQYNELQNLTHGDLQTPKKEYEQRLEACMQRLSKGSGVKDSGVPTAERYHSAESSTPVRHVESSRALRHAHTVSVRPDASSSSRLTLSEVGSKWHSSPSTSRSQLEPLEEMGSTSRVASDIEADVGKVKSQVNSDNDCSPASPKAGPRPKSRSPPKTQKPKQTKSQLEQEAKKILALEDKQKEETEIEHFINDVALVVDDHLGQEKHVNSLRITREFNQERQQELIKMRKKVRQLRQSARSLPQQHRVIAYRARHKQVLQAIRSVASQVLSDIRCIARWGATLGSRCTQVADSITVLTARAMQGETAEELESDASTELAVLKHTLLSLYPGRTPDPDTSGPFSNQGALPEQGAQALRNLEITLRCAPVFVGDAAERVDPDSAASCWVSSPERREPEKEYALRRPWLPSQADEALKLYRDKLFHLPVTNYDKLPHQ